MTNFDKCKPGADCSTCQFEEFCKAIRAMWVVGLDVCLTTKYGIGHPKVMGQMANEIANMVYDGITKGVHTYLHHLYTTYGNEGDSWRNVIEKAVQAGELPETALTEADEADAIIDQSHSESKDIPDILH